MTPKPGSEGERVHLLVPLSESPTVDATAEYAAREARELAADVDGAAVVHFVTVGRGDPTPTARREGHESMQRRAIERARDALGIETASDDDPVAFETATIEQETYPYDPITVVDSLVEYARANDVDAVVLDPEYRMPTEAPIHRPLEAELSTIDGLTLELAPVERPARHRRLRTRGGLAQFLTLVGATYAFYLVIGGVGGTFDGVTGAVTALVVATVLHRVTFERPPHLRWIAGSTARWILYVPYLLWKIVTANVQIAAVVLHPRLPIDPQIVRFEAAVWGGVPITTLANSITLTPGTLTVDVRNREFVVHTLTPRTRDDLLDGSLERAVRFVFYGRRAMRHPSPGERIDAVDDSPRVPVGDGGDRLPGGREDASPTPCGRSGVGPDAGGSS